jgi:hypothetical protein
MGLYGFSLTGCATIQPIPSTQQAYEQWLADNWTGKDVNVLIYSWGPPTSTFTMPNGDKMFTWANIKIGPTVTSGRSNKVYGTTYSNSISFTNTWDCFTTAITNSAGIISSWKMSGNNCLRLDWNNATEDQRKLYFFEQLKAGDKITLEILNKDNSTYVHEFIFLGVTNMGTVYVRQLNYWSFDINIEFKNIVSYKITT